MNKSPFQDEYLLSGFRLTRFRVEDAKVVAGKLATIDPWLALGYSAIHLENYLSTIDPSLHCYTIMVDNVIVGVVAVRYPWLRGAYLELIGLFPDAQRRGLGTAILDWLEQETTPWAANLWVLVSSFNDSAKRFYLRQGFRVIGDIEALVSLKSTELLLRKVLRLPTQKSKR
jgi:ribosomal protein S18 acetylase RimI-like enzyme